DAEDEPGYRHALAGLPAVRLPDLGNRDGAEDERKERAQPVQPDDPENEARDREAVRARPPGDHDRRRIRRVGSVGGRRRIGLERRLGGWRNRARQGDRMGTPGGWTTGGDSSSTGSGSARFAAGALAPARAAATIALMSSMTVACSSGSCRPGLSAEASA